MFCTECYSDDDRATPLLGAKECLEGHMQYVCGSCDRCICIAKDENRHLQRWNFPFKTQEIAKLYLRAADVSAGRNCGIYEITDEKRKKSYKIFAQQKDLLAYLAKNKGRQCLNMAPLYKRNEWVAFTQQQIRRLGAAEVEKYLLEQEAKKARK